jgi:hypothetical protein
MANGIACSFHDENARVLQARSRVSAQNADSLALLHGSATRLIGESRAFTEGGLAAIFPPMGLEQHRKRIQLAIDWALDPKILPRRLREKCLMRHRRLRFHAYFPAVANPKKVPANLTFVQSRATNERIFFKLKRLY